ncbi:MAG: AraC family transcriptional regulator [Cytophagaceae bacterium]|nr:AraC family transcriptional regulator [Cytophagaceae bacterium]
MEATKRFDSVTQYNDHMGVETLHPLVSVIDFDVLESIQHVKRYMGIYAVFLKNIKCGNMRYGCEHYDYEEGTLVFVSPGQVYGIEDNGAFIKPSGKALVFHSDMIHGTALGQNMKNYTFFSYEVNEALHLSKRERSVIIDCFDRIAFELERDIDNHSKTLIVSYIELLLNHAMRFYDRQFITRKHVNTGILGRFEKLMDEYYSSKEPQVMGLPSVGYCADRLHLSANYFGDLVKKETGKTAQEYIQVKVIDQAKGRILDYSKSISEISYELGFKYPSHFTRLFKQKTGQTPNEYRMMN